LWIIDTLFPILLNDHLKEQEEGTSRIRRGGSWGNVYKELWKKLDGINRKIVSIPFKRIARLKPMIILNAGGTPKYGAIRTALGLRYGGKMFISMLCTDSHTARLLLGKDPFTDDEGRNILEIDVGLLPGEEPEEKVGEAAEAFWKAIEKAWYAK